MGRRSDHSRDELHELALDAAGRIVDSEGFGALTARRVADAIGYSPGTLYNVFADLDDMIIGLNGRSLDILIERLERTNPSRDPNTYVLRLLDTYLAFESEHPNLWSVLFEHRLQTGRLLPEWYLARVDHALRLVERALSPLFPPDSDEDKQLAARTLWASLHGILSLAKSGKLKVVTTETGRGMARHMVANYLTGLAHRESGAGNA